jgi:C_GCAxxG_C_C family probable redox protein
MAGEVCGALSGAVLAIGLIYGEEQEEAVPHLTESFMNRFAEQHGEIRCADIIGFNFAKVSTSEDMGSVKDIFWFIARGGKRQCNKVVANAVQVVLEELNEWER